MHDTIFAPVSAVGPSSAISVFRVSGNNSSTILKTLTKEERFQRESLFLKIYFPFKKKNTRHMFNLLMPKPNSFTGEDCFDSSLSWRKNNNKSIYKCLY